MARECDEVAPGTLLVLERLGNYPAVVLNGRYDVLAYNRAYEALVGDLGSLCFDERNVLWVIFTSPTMRELLVDWEQVARTCVARYRARMATHASERAWRGLVKRLAAASEDFTRIWGEHEVTGTDTTLKRFAHAELGLLSYHATVYSCTERVGNRFIAYTPADEVTTRRTEDLDQPGAPIPGLYPRRLGPRARPPPPQPSIGAEGVSSSGCGRTSWLASPRDQFHLETNFTSRPISPRDQFHLETNFTSREATPRSVMLSL